MESHNQCNGNQKHVEVRHSTDNPLASREPELRLVAIARLLQLEERDGVKGERPLIRPAEDGVDDDAGAVEEHDEAEAAPYSYVGFPVGSKYASVEDEERCLDEHGADGIHLEDNDRALAATGVSIVGFGTAEIIIP